MLLLNYSRSRLVLFLEEIRRLKGSEFPYLHSKEALGLIESYFANQLDYLNNLLVRPDSAAGDTITTASKITLSTLFTYLPIVGLILRSTNVRNAFELYGPLLNLARRILGEETKLILSSEWEYSPCTYFAMPLLSNYVLIGFPAPESANPLLAPLAGHELGHSIWFKNSHSKQITQKIEGSIISSIQSRWEEYSGLHPGIEKKDLGDLLGRATWESAYIWALYQSQETFCDFVGLRIFRESFLHAFAYLLAPTYGGERSVLYPSTKTRISNLLLAATKYGVGVPPDYDSLFQDSPNMKRADPFNSFLLSLADLTLPSVIDELINWANEAVERAGIVESESAHVDDILRYFSKFIVPPKDPRCLADILNAAWKAFHSEELWENLVAKENRSRVLRDLVLKTIQVLEIRQYAGEAK